MDYKRVLILRFTNGMSSREIAETTGDGKTTINEFLKRFRECEELSYPLSEEVTNEFIANCLYKKAGNLVNSDLYRDFDPEEVHRTLSKKGESLKHLWKKYNAVGVVNGRKPLSYRQYCRRYSNWLDSTNVTFHIQRVPGINSELDFAGIFISLDAPYSCRDFPCRFSQIPSSSSYRIFDTRAPVPLWSCASSACRSTSAT